MNSKKYWEKRTAQEAYKMYEDAEKVAEELKKAYSGASAYLQKQAEGIFEKFRVKYGLSEAEARRLLRSLDDSTSLKELMQKLQTWEQTDDIRLLREHIEAAAYGARLRRLEQIQDTIDRLMKRLFGKTFRLASDWLQKLAGESYLRHIFDISQRAGFLVQFNGLSTQSIMKLLQTKWLGGNYSSRLWENTKRLAEKLKEELLISMLTGRTDRETANVINDEFRKGASAARRLVRTESNHVYTEARFIGAEECGIEEYIFLATLDLRTSKICRSLDGNRFKVKDRKVGTNCPPMHPWCRSTTLDYFGEEWLKNGTRFALDPVTEKRIKVPMSMTYEEWYDKYVKGHEKEIAEKEKQPQSRNLTREQYDRYRQRGVGPDSYEEFIKLKGDPEAWAKLQEEYRRAGKSMKEQGTRQIVTDNISVDKGEPAEVTIESKKSMKGGKVYRDQKIKTKSSGVMDEKPAVGTQKAATKHEVDIKSENTDAKLPEPKLAEAVITQEPEEAKPVTEEKLENVAPERNLDHRDDPSTWPDDLIITNTWEDDEEFRQGYEDITEEALTDVAPNTNPVEDITDFAQDGRRYTVDGVNVKLEYEPKEKQTAELLQRKLGVTVQMMPKVSGDYKHVETPDYLVDGERWDRKGVEGNSPKYVYNTIHKKKQQAETFVLCMTDRTSLQLQEVIRQAQEVFFNYHTRFVKQIIVVDKNGNIVRILKRK